jgi:hypothetical protein
MTFLAHAVYSLVILSVMRVNAITCILRSKLVSASNFNRFRKTTSTAVTKFPSQLNMSSGISVLVNNLESVKERIMSTAIKCERDPNSIHLIAVSKTKPIENIEELYSIGHREFGENYAEELIEKASVLPDDISWHFIGHLQSGKVKSLIERVPSLKCIETIDSRKLATKIQNKLLSLGRSPLDIFLQIDTSGEETKSGVTIEEAIDLAAFIKETCPLLIIKGVMTIGSPGDISCFDRLVEARAEVFLTKNLH